jgi:dihydrofolate synthase/folylpolyglutamate synthase
VTSETARSTVRYEDQGFSVVTNRPRLVGAHQSRNLALAIAMLRHQGALHIPEAAMRAAADWAHWPARMQRLSDGPLLATLPGGSELWLDGAHNPNAAQPVARALRTLAKGRPVTLVLGMLANKDAEAVVRILSPSVGHVVAIPVPGHAHHAPEALATLARSFGKTVAVAATPGEALASIAAHTDQPQLVLIAGSLYLAGEVLAANDQPPE